MVEPYGRHLVVKRRPLEVPHDVPSRFGQDGALIIAPEIAKAKSRRGTVIRVGPGVREQIRQGDEVLITWLDGTRYEDVDDGEVEIFLETEILAIVEE